jgi:hypothetical protein
MDTIQPSNQLERKLEQFDENQKKEIFKNMFAIQLTQGCSTGCKDCGLGAEKGVVDYIPSKFLMELFDEYGKIIKNNHPLLYFASDPFDYDFEGVNYLKIHNHFKNLTEKNPCVITSIPKGKENLILNTLKNEIKTEAEAKIIDCISLTEYNYKRIESFFNNEPELVKEMNHYRKPIYNKFYDPNNPFEIFLYNLDSGVVRNYYKGLENRIKIGGKNKENPENKRISTYIGTLMTPKGIYNVLPVNTTKENPIGQEITEITTKDFLVHNYGKRYSLP